MTEINTSNIRKILVITLTNIGDAILTFPVMDALLNAYPNAELSVMAAPKSSILFENNKNITTVYQYNKKDSLIKKMNQFLQLREQKFDMVVDLKNSALSHFVGAKYTTPPEMKRDVTQHMYKKHMNRLKGILPSEPMLTPKHFFEVSDDDQKIVNDLLSCINNSKQQFVVIAPGSLNEFKCWAQENYVEVAQHISAQYQLPIVLVGDKSDAVIAEGIAANGDNIYNLCGKTTLVQCAEIIKRARLVIANDSGPMHMACYLNKPVVAIFGPSNEKQYGPWNKNSVYLKGTTPFHNKNLKKDQSTYTDVNSVKVQDVINAFKIEADGVKLNHV